MINPDSPHLCLQSCRMQPSGKGVDLRPRTALLTQALLFASLVALSICMTGSRSCPSPLDCAQMGRRFCQPGSLHCGPCLNPLVENSHGRCVVKMRRASHSGKVLTFPEVDEDIDFLSSIISQQQENALHHSAPFSQDIPKAKEEEPEMQRPTPRPTTERPTSPSSTPPTTTVAPVTRNDTPAVRSPHDPIIAPYPYEHRTFLIVASVFSILGCLALLIAGVYWIRLQKGTLLAQKVDYPACRGMGLHSSVTNPGDKKLAQRAQMYHYRHHKQQMLSAEKHRDEPKVHDSVATSDEENEEGDFTVYECPGLAPTGEMEVRNPLFDDSPHYLQRNHK